jgi:hypothetical protein
MLLQTDLNLTDSALDIIVIILLALDLRYKFIFLIKI